MTFAAIYAIIIGIIMIFQWAVTIMKKQVAGPEAGIGQYSFTPFSILQDLMISSWIPIIAVNSVLEKRLF